MKKSLRQTVYMRKYVEITNDISEIEINWLSPQKIKLSLQPASGRMLYETYGSRINYMLTAYAPKGLKIAEGDGLCINVRMDKDPDYTVVAVNKYPRHNRLLLEKAVTSGGHRSSTG